MTDLGPLRGGHDACLAIEGTLTLWLPSVLRVITTLPDYPQDLPVPPLVSAPDADVLRAGTVPVPCIATSSPGTSRDAIDRHGSGLYDASWQVVVSVFAVGASVRDTAARVRAYTLAIRAAVMQHKSLGGAARTTTWQGEDYDRVDSRATSNLGGGYVFFDVDLSNVLNDRAGPSVPDAPPLPTVLTTHPHVTVLEDS